MADKITLYHGSRNGLHGDIAPSGRPERDYGQGFYLAEKKDHPTGLIAPDIFPESCLYTMQLDLSDLKVFTFEEDLRWALFVAYNRGKADLTATPELRELENEFRHINSDYDVLTGTIANDSMTFVLGLFTANALSYQALIQCMSVIKPGKQYVLKTDKACSHTEILRTDKLTPEQRKQAIERSEAMTKKVKEQVQEIQRKDREDGN